jgi:hypothetical protein
MSSTLLLSSGTPHDHASTTAAEEAVESSNQHQLLRAVSVADEYVLHAMLVHAAVCSFAAHSASRH